MMEWADENEPAPWNHYFDHISLNRAVWHIKDGGQDTIVLLIPTVIDGAHAINT